MKLGYLNHTTDLSVRNYFENVIRNLEKLGVEILPFGFSDPLPEGSDLYWDPRLTGARTPTERFLRTSKPCVATLHGIVELSLPPWELFVSTKHGVKIQINALRNLVRWNRRWKRKCAAIITVSQFDKQNIQKKLFLRSENIVPIYPAVDHDLFVPHASNQKSGRYLLHVSAYTPKKNVNRVIAAYRALDSDKRPEMILVVPGYPKELSIPGLKMIRKPMSHKELVPLFQNAMGFVFPSLHEGFGFPIIEAMACGCPVITSNVSACPETAGDAALLVNPRSVKDIASSMKRLMSEPELASSLREKGIARAKMFTWEESAKGHLNVFEKAIAAS